MHRNEIIDFLRSHKHELHDKFQVDKIGVCGSYARDEENPKSDIDFYVEFAKNSFDNLTGLSVYLEKQFQKKVDIIYPHTNHNQLLIDNVQKEAVFG